MRYLQSGVLLVDDAMMKMCGVIRMEFETANRVGESTRIVQEQQSREKITGDGASFLDTINAKATESKAETTSDIPADETKADYALTWASREMARCRRRYGMWINQIRKHRMDAERRAYCERHEEYVKMLKASSLKRSLQESAHRRYMISSVARDVALGAYGIEYKKQYGGFF